MSDFNIRSDSVDVEQLMEQIRARIREKRGVDYTEQQLRELAAVKLERFLDPRGVRSDLLEQFRNVQAEHKPSIPPNYLFDSETLYQTHRPLLRLIRRLLNPVLRLFFNPNKLVDALHNQSRLNTVYIERYAVDQLHFEIAHNLVVETTRLGIEVKNLKMQVESLISRLEFNERRARALESAVVYRPSDGQAAASAAGPEARPRPPGADATPFEPGVGGPVSTAPGGSHEGPGQRSRRRRRRRGRRGGGPAVAMMGQPPTGAEQAAPDGEPASPVDEHPGGDAVPSRASDSSVRSDGEPGTEPQ